MSPWKCAVLWPLSSKAQFVGLPQSTLKFFPGGEKRRTLLQIGVVRET